MFGVDHASDSQIDLREGVDGDLIGQRLGAVFDDELLVEPRYERFEAGLPDAEAVVIEGLGHVPHTEGPERTLEAVRAWLARADL